MENVYLQYHCLQKQSPLKESSTSYKGTSPKGLKEKEEICVFEKIGTEITVKRAPKSFEIQGEKD